PGEYLLWAVKKGGRQCLQGIITPEEFAGYFFDQFCLDEKLHIHLAPQLLVEVPEIAREEIKKMARKILDPKYSRSNAGWQKSEYTARQKAWAAEIQRLLEADPKHLHRRANLECDHDGHPQG